MNTLTALDKIGTDKEAIFVQVISAIIRKGPQGQDFGLGSHNENLFEKLSFERSGESV